MSPEEALAKRTMETIIEHGHQVRCVFPTDGGGHYFAYTVGRTLKDRPELLITGLSPEVACSVLNSAAAYDDNGGPLAAGADIPADTILSGFPCRVIAADPNASEMVGALELDSDLVALQVVWPDRNGAFPGDPWCRVDKIQPLFPQEQPDE